MFGRKERSTPYQRDPLVTIEDLRDDCIALFRDSGMTMKAVHEAGGPTPHTISKWLYHETRFPRLDSMKALVKAIGGEIMIVGPQIAAQLRRSGPRSRLELDGSYGTKLDTLAHKARQKAHRAPKKVVPRHDPVNA